MLSIKIFLKNGIVGAAPVKELPIQKAPRAPEAYRAPKAPEKPAGEMCRGLFLCAVLYTEKTRILFPFKLNGL